MLRLRWMIIKLARKLWVRTCLLGTLGIVTAILATLADSSQMQITIFNISQDAIDSLLTIIASSMLAVATFSLSIMTSAFNSVTSNATPRATQLIVEDQLTQNVLATFIGSFLFSIVGLVVLKADAYGPQGRIVLFLVTIIVLAQVVVYLIRWIDHLSRLGRVGDAIGRVENAAHTSIVKRIAQPYLGGTPLLAGFETPRSGSFVGRSIQTGYVTHIDMEGLQAIADYMSAQVHVLVIPGNYAYPGTPLAWVDAKPGDDTAKKTEQALIGCFDFDCYRDFDQDPVHGFIVLSEIAQRGLSPGINDPGTAIDVLGRMAGLLNLWAGASSSIPEGTYPGVQVPGLPTAELFEHAFERISRDGAGQIEVQLKLREILAAMAGIGGPNFREAARRQADIAMKRASAELDLQEDIRKLQDIRLAA